MNHIELLQILAKDPSIPLQYLDIINAALQEIARLQKENELLKGYLKTYLLDEEKK